MNSQVFTVSDRLSVALGIIVLVGLGLVAVIRMTSRSQADGTTARVRLLIRNAGTPMLAQLFNKGVDLIFAMFVLRALGPTGNGELAFATVVWLYSATVADFGLTVWEARETAARPGSEPEVLGSSFLLRCIVTFAVWPIGLALVGAYLWGSNISPAGALTATLFLISILPANWAAALTGILNGREMLVVPALVTLFTNTVRFVVGIAALLLGFGVISVGLASITAGTLGMVALHWAFVRSVGHVRPAFRSSTLASVAHDALPLMVNGLLLNLFFRIDVFVLQAFWGSRELGLYDAAYKVVNLSLLIPTYTALALLPQLSRQWGTDADQFSRTVNTGIRILAVVGFALAGAVWLSADALIAILGGRSFLPDSAEALRMLIWFAPISYANALLQHALIASRRQQFVTIAFLVALIFNLAANLIAVPTYGFRAAAVMTVATEAVLMVSLAWPAAQTLRGWRWLAALLRAVPAFTCTAIAVRAFDALGTGAEMQLVLALLIYLGVTVATGAIKLSELALLRRAVV
jgi:O-antigen/teichoic acid export membrane protein